MASEESTSGTPDTEGMSTRISRLEEYMRQNSETMLRQEQLMVSLAQVSQSIIERLDTPLRVQGGGNEQLAAMAEVVPMTLDRQPGVDSGGVLQDLGSEMASVARRECGSIRRHDARPPSLETRISIGPEPVLAAHAQSPPAAGSHCPAREGSAPH